MSQPDFWQNQQRVKDISQELNDLKEEKERWEKIEKELADLNELSDLLGAESKQSVTKSLPAPFKEEEQDLEKELEKKYFELERIIAKEELKTFFSGKYDRNDALLTIMSGAGGTEAQDWAQMLLRMYTRYGERHNFEVKVLHIHEGQEAGIKNATLEFCGPYAYGCLKGEAGVHRLVRLSPFNANNLRHTSFALVEVLPEFDELPDIKIDPKDLKIDTYRSSGPGGQNVNKVETAVRLTHEPSGIVVACQSERSQAANKEKAMKMLLSKLYHLQQQQLQEEKNKIRAGQKVSEGTAEWGGQIRSYVLHPYKMVKDLRTGIESRQPEKVLDGELDEFIEAEIVNLRGHSRR